MTSAPDASSTSTPARNREVDERRPALEHVQRRASAPTPCRRRARCARRATRRGCAARRAASPGSARRALRRRPARGPPPVGATEIGARDEGAVVAREHLDPPRTDDAQVAVEGVGRDLERRARERRRAERERAGRRALDHGEIGRRGRACDRPRPRAARDRRPRRAAGARGGRRAARRSRRARPAGPPPAGRRVPRCANTKRARPVALVAPTFRR